MQGDTLVIAMRSSILGAFMQRKDYSGIFPRLFKKTSRSCRSIGVATNESPPRGHGEFLMGVSKISGFDTSTHEGWVRHKLAACQHFEQMLLRVGADSPETGQAYHMLSYWEGLLRSSHDHPLVIARVPDHRVRAVIDRIHSIEISSV
jgi:hypothetical protein